jgi:UDPglucose--hexose-1-phosphate uridylyltransferase
MAELRKDQILEKYVIIASERAKRPDEFSEEDIHAAPKAVDIFAPGNEHMTPPEKGRIGNPWRMRWFDNKFSAVDSNNSPNLSSDFSTSNQFYTFAKAFGVHEVIVETPDSRQQWDLEEHELFDLFKIYIQRIRELSQVRGVKYVQVFKNNGHKAGCSIQHSHSQIIALNIVPSDVISEEKAVEEYFLKNLRNPYDDIFRTEFNSFREVYRDNRIFAFCPYASRYPMQVRIMPLRNVISALDLQDDELKNMSIALHKVLVKLKKINMPYNMFFRYGLKHQRFYIDVLPRPNLWAGFELATGIIINPFPPEDAARFYKEK